MGLSMQEETQLSLNAPSRPGENIVGFSSQHFVYIIQKMDAYKILITRLYMFFTFHIDAYIEISFPQKYLGSTWKPSH